MKARVQVSSEPTRILSQPQTQRSHVRAHLGASMMLGRAASHTTEGSAATSGSTTEDLGLHSAQVLHAYWVKCHDLRAAIRARNHQGRPGRHRAEDTARVRFIDGWVMPSLATRQTADGARRQDALPRPESHPRHRRSGRGLQLGHGMSTIAPPPRRRNSRIPCPRSRRSNTCSLRR